MWTKYSTQADSQVSTLNNMTVDSANQTSSEQTPKGTSKMSTSYTHQRPSHLVGWHHHSTLKYSKMEWTLRIALRLNPNVTSLARVTEHNMKKNLNLDARFTKKTTSKAVLLVSTRLGQVIESPRQGLTKTSKPMREQFTYRTRDSPYTQSLTTLRSKAWIRLVHVTSAKLCVHTVSIKKRKRQGQRHLSVQGTQSSHGWHSRTYTSQMTRCKLRVNRDFKCTSKTKKNVSGLQCLYRESTLNPMKDITKISFDVCP